MKVYEIYASKMASLRSSNESYGSRIHHEDNLGDNYKIYHNYKAPIRTKEANRRIVSTEQLAEGVRMSGWEAGPAEKRRRTMFLATPPNPDYALKVHTAQQQEIPAKNDVTTATSVSTGSPAAAAASHVCRTSGSLSLS